MNEMAIKVLFVCSDNTGRSLIAEYLFKNWLRKHNRNDIEVFSCGTDANSDVSSFCFDHIGKLKEMGIDASKHKRTQLTKELFFSCDIVIAMDETHQKYVKENYSTDIPLYNELYKNEKTSILITPPGATGPLSDRLLKTVDYINDSMNDLVTVINGYKNKNDQTIDPEKYEVFILRCPAHVPFSFAIHPWFVCNEKGMISRWEVLFRANKDELWGFLHQNHSPPFSGIEIFPFSTKWHWQSSLVKKVEGELAKSMIDLIKTSKENYPYIQSYASGGTNSNTYAQWVLNHFPEVDAKLPWNAFGKNAK